MGESAIDIDGGGWLGLTAPGADCVTEPAIATQLLQ